MFGRACAVIVTLIPVVICFAIGIAAGILVNAFTLGYEQADSIIDYIFTGETEQK